MVIGVGDLAVVPVAVVTARIVRISETTAVVAIWL